MRSRFNLAALIAFAASGFLRADDVAPTKPVEITLMISPADQVRPTWQKVSDEFNASHPDIHFHIIWSDIRPKLNLLTVAGALPDLLATADISLVLLHDKLIGLDQLFDEIPGAKTQYYPALLQSCRYNGKLLLIPTRYNVPFIYYRPDLFRKAGLPEPAPGWTWDDYRRDAKALTQVNPDGTVAIYGTNVQTVWWVEWLGLIRQAGGEALTDDGQLKINSPATLKAVQLLHNLIHVDHSAPLPRDAPPNGFENGRIAMFYGGHVSELGPLRDHAPFEWDIAPLPAGPAGNATGELAVQGLGVSAQCQHPEAAFEVLRFLTSKEVALELAQGGMTPPVRRDIAAATILAGTPQTRTVRPYHAEVLVDSLAFARSAPKLAVFLPVSKAIGDEIDHALGNPDASSLPALPAQLDALCRVQLDLAKDKTHGNPLFFVAQIVLLGAVAFLLLRRFWQSTPETAEERLGRKYFFLFTAPCVVGLCLFTLWPLLLSFWWAQTDYNLVDTPHYVGLAQYRALLFQDPEFWHSLKLSLAYAVLAVPLGLIIALVTALLLNQELRHVGAFRVLFYLPSILPVAASSMMWIWLLHPRYGVVNHVLAFFGLPQPGWLQDPNWAMPSLVLISLWGFGGPMLIFLAGLKNIPDSLYEAAAIDGAGPFSRFWHITLPSLSPVLFFNLTMGCIGALQVFDLAYIVSTAIGGDEAAGGPQRSTNFYILYLYFKSFTNLQIGAGSAMAWLFFIVILSITILNFWARRFWLVPESERS